MCYYQMTCFRAERNATAERPPFKSSQSKDYHVSGPIPSTPGALDDRELKLMIGAVASVLFIASLGQTVVTTALPTILSELGGLSQITWVITAYLMAATVGAPVFPRGTAVTLVFPRGTHRLRAANPLRTEWVQRVQRVQLP